MFFWGEEPSKILWSKTSAFSLSKTPAEQTTQADKTTNPPCLTPTFFRWQAMQPSLCFRPRNSCHNRCAPFYTLENEHFETPQNGGLVQMICLFNGVNFRLRVNAFSGRGFFFRGGGGETLPSPLQIETRSQHNAPEKEWNRKDNVTISIYFLFFRKWILSHILKVILTWWL